MVRRSADVSKPAKKHYALRGRKKTLISLCVIMALVGVGGYFLLSNYQVSRDNKAQAEADQLLRESPYLSAVRNEPAVREYLVAVTSGDSPAAMSALESALAAATTDNERDLVLNDYYQAAWVAGQHDHVRFIIQRQLEYRSGFEMYMKAAQAYAYVNDDAKRIEYLKKAQATLQPDDTQARQDIQSTIDSIEKVRT